MVDWSEKMTVTYSLTRAEILRTFLYTLPRSPRILILVSGTACLMAYVSLSGNQAFSRGLSLNDLISALLWFVGTFCFMAVWIFLRAKAKERTLTISENGIYTEIGGMKGSYPWQRLKEIKDIGQYLLVVTNVGNAFFIPRRAFTDANQRALFIEEIDHYRAAR